MSFEEICQERKMCYEGIIVNVRRDKVRLHNGAPAQREVVEHPGGVAVFALDEQKRVVFVRQFRYSVGEEVLELPAGKLEPGEDPKCSALRELEEETGLRPATIQSLGYSYSSPGIFSEKIYLFLAQDLHEGEAHPDEDEFLDILRIPLDSVLPMIAAGDIVDAKTIAATMKALLVLKGESFV